MRSNINALISLIMFSFLYFPVQNMAESGDMGTNFLGRAYSLFLLASYDSSVVYYQKAIKSGSGSVEPYQGLMNCYIALKQYENAIKAGVESPDGGRDYFILQKTAQAFAFQNKNGAADSVYLIVRSITGSNGIPEYMEKDFLMSVGDSYLQNGNYSQARRWFGRGDSIFGDAQFRNALHQTDSVHQDSRKTEVNLIGGLIDYQGTTTLRKGNYGGIGTGLLFKQVHRINIGYSYLGIENKTVFVDTVDKLKDAVVLYGKLWEHDLLISYTKLYQLLDKTMLQCGMRISRSNILYTNLATTQYLGHLTRYGPFTGGAYWYYTRLQGHNLFQFSPHLALGFQSGNKYYEFKAVPNFVNTISYDGQPSDIPLSWQVSGDLSFLFSFKRLCFTFTGSAGRRAFLNEPEALVLLNETDRFLYGWKVLCEYSPFKFPMTFYYLLRRSRFEPYSSVTGLGGIFFRW